MADLLDATNSEALRTSSFAFIDDTHILIYRNSTERNCRTLKRIYKEYKKWLKTQRAKFAPKKYELIYFIKRLKYFNIRAIIRIGEIEKVAIDYIKILEI